MKRAAKTVPSLRSPARRIRREGDNERFESLVDELSAAIARAQVDEIDKTIDEWLSKIVLALDVDRGTIWERGAPYEGFIATHWWARPGIPGLPARMLSQQIGPWATSQALAGKTYTFSSPEELPKQAVRERRFLKEHGPRAQAMVPLQIGGTVLGGLTFGKFRAPRHWSQHELQRLRIVGQIIAGSMERKQNALRSRKLRDEIAVASRRSTLGELAASIAHELNQPLAAILSNLGGLARLLSQQHQQPTGASIAVRNAIQDTKRAAEIVRRLRNMFKTGETHRTANDVRSLVQEVVALVNNEAAFRGIRLHFEESPSTLHATVDRVQVQQCVMNLIINALEAIAQITSGPREVTITTASETGGWIRVSVSDTGVGIDPTIGAQIFEPFVTSKSKGMGLGLLVTRSIVESHGGRIWFVPNPDRGTTFSFTLPPAPGERIRASRHHKPRSSADPTPVRADDV
ncbi:MAG: GAF domain-containing sensor histidine kinase [Deltaproteobacteria bacterium]|nr:GAF domain-containing sensor histidine kinase [Deltaproteobacteria bacterium]